MMLTDLGNMKSIVTFVDGLKLDAEVLYLHNRRYIMVYDNAYWIVPFAHVELLQCTPEYTYGKRVNKAEVVTLKKKWNVTYVNGHCKEVPIWHEVK